MNVTHSLDERMIGNEYRLFAAVVDAASLAGAGRALGISPSMVSKRLAALEERLGTRLVNRTTRRLSLTERGARFHDEVTAILASMREAERRVSDRTDHPSGPLRLSLPTSFGRLHVVPHLKAFLDTWPDIELTLDMSDGLRDLFAERIDVAIRITAAITSGLTAHHLAPSRRLLCAAPSYLEAYGAPRSIADLGHHRLLAATGQLPWQLDGPSGPRIVRGRSAVNTNSSEAVRELALAGVGIALRSIWDVGTELRERELIPVLPAYQGSLETGIYAVYPAGAPPTAAARACIEFLEALFARMEWAAGGG
ncbi:putative LysR-type transcriptional regulator [Sphingobium herbicidovorans NBRC 16415]|uniref:LysR-type transcriptional regulator n=2 Tax=Sphingomonadaceae TaxID=41297 RepID=A0A086P8V8_SPHHM|nr:putative LysR-type transcriptional regulator [Sphingomonas sp. ERG5]KFG89826.1 putative LysR-type transcriptional regulator [Sphingobium herbicidovorans NBRC 16415]